MTIRTACIAAGAVALALPAFADPKPGKLQKLGAGRQVQPTKVASCELINGKAVLTSDWVDLGPVLRNPPDTFAYDCYEDDGTGFPGEDLWCNAAGGETGRWYFGLTANNPFVSNDMTTDAAGAGASCEGVYLAWYWNIDEVGGAPYDDSDLDGSLDQDMILAIFTSEDFDAPADSTGGCDDDGSTSVIPGVAYTFAALEDADVVAVVGDEGYYFTNIDLTGSGLSHVMPADGVGGHLLIFGSAEDPVTGAIILTGGAADIWSQPMLWGTGDDEVGSPNPITRIGTQDSLHFDDDAPLDGLHTLACFPAGEGYDYAFGVCPDPIGTMIAFRYKGGVVPCPCPGDVNGDGIRDIADLGLFLAAFGLPATNCADINGDGVVDIADLGLFLAGFGVPC